MRRLQSSLLAAVAAIGFATVASAADMPTKAPIVKAPVPVVYDWTGFYIGGDVGWAHAQQDASTNGTPSPGFGAPAIVGAGAAGFGVLPTSHDLNGDSFMGGIHAGYNLQTMNWVYGLEGDFMFLGRNKSDTETLFSSFSAPIAFGTMNVSAKNDWLASLRGRVGWLATPTWLLYATGGAAFTHTSYSAAFTTTPGALTPAQTNTMVDFSQSKLGFAVGAGSEWMVAPHWLLRAEYLYYGFEGSSGVLPYVSPTSSCTPGLCNWNVSASRLQFQTARIGVSYKF